MAKRKFQLECRECGAVVPRFEDFFATGQVCPDCGSPRLEVRYADYGGLDKALARRGGYVPLWHYKDVLPINDESNIISAGEGAVAIERWGFLEKFARETTGMDIKVAAHRHDNCNATGTFKDLAASVAASVLRENGVAEYVVSSTGNIGVAYSRYLSQTDIPLYVFIPEDSSVFQAAEVACFGQKVFKVEGDYRRAKELAAEFAEKNGILSMGGTFDPMRIEAKKTMAYEWVRQMDELPTVYIQALSGGTGPFGVAVGCEDLLRGGHLAGMPRMILAQSDKCSPMADAWAKAKKAGFPDGWETTYPVYDSPETEIVTLSTGDPTAYPALAPLVRQSAGAILAVPEDRAVEYARLVAFESAVRIGPAAAIAVGGFIRALQGGEIRDGDVVLVNIGEGMRRAPDFMAKMVHSLSHVRTLADCSRFEREKYRTQLWREVVGE